MVLSFLVDKQTITRVDKEKVVRDSMNYLYASFSFSPDWTGEKTAVFKSKSGAFNVLLDEDDKCLVPWEVLVDEVIEVSVFCGALITANVVKIITIASGYTLGESGRVPTPGIYEQIIAKLNEIEAEIDPEAIQALIDAYLADKDFVTDDDLETAIANFVTESDVNNIVAAYVDAHKSEWQGSEVTVTPTLSTGTKIAEIEVDGTTTNLYAPSGGGGASSLDDLTDVDITTPAAGDVLVYDGQKWGNGKSNPYVGKTVVHMGDSIIDLYNVAELSAQKAGYNVTNCGFQATSYISDYNIISNSQYYSLIRLTESIASDDWSEQDNHTNVVYAAHLAALKSIDWSEVDVLILSYGTNDYLQQKPLCDTYAKDEVSIEGVIKKVISTFKAINPTMEIIITTPIYRVPFNGQLTDIGYNDNDLIAYRNHIALMASKLGVKVVDLFALSGIDAFNASELLIDGLHPNEAGQEMWVNAFVGAMASGFVGGVMDDVTKHTFIDGMANNLIFDSEIYTSHFKKNATFFANDKKWLCPAGSAINDECILFYRVYSSVPIGTKFHFQAECKSTTEDAHRLGIRFYSNADHEDKFDKHMDFTSQTTAWVEFTTDTAYTNIVALFYVRNLTAFEDSQALCKNAYATIT